MRSVDCLHANLQDMQAVLALLHIVFPFFFPSLRWMMYVLPCDEVIPKAKVEVSGTTRACTIYISLEIYENLRANLRA